MDVARNFVVNFVDVDPQFDGDVTQMPLPKAANCVWEHAGADAALSTAFVEYDRQNSLCLHEAFGSGRSSALLTPQCSRPSCPCSSTWNNLPGEYCCETCRDGQPCRFNQHCVPFEEEGKSVSVDFKSMIQEIETAAGHYAIHGHE